ncbi:MAG: glycosyltransferase family 2 protein [Candidatus Bathyarchaeia archaeon]
MKIRVSVIVLNWNGKKWLKNCLSSILSQGLDEKFEVLLVDNGSTDGSVEYVEQNFPQVKVIKLDRNYGFAEGNNRGAKFACGDYLVFVNMDTKAEDGWLKNLVKAADEHPEYQILCSIQLPSQERNRIRTLNAFGDAMPSPYESDLAITDSIFASGGCFLIRRSWLNKLGYLFDPFYFCSAEDIELSLRTILLGGRIGYVRDSRIWHYIGGANYPSAKMAYLSERNLLLTYYKLLVPKNFAKIFLVHTGYLAIRLVTRRRQLLKTLNMMKGLLGFFKTFHHYEAYRREFAKTKTRDERYVFERFLYRRWVEKAIVKNFLI